MCYYHDIMKQYMELSRLSCEVQSLSGWQCFGTEQLPVLLGFLWLARSGWQQAPKIEASQPAGQATAKPAGQASQASHVERWYVVIVKATCFC